MNFGIVLVEEILNGELSTNSKNRLNMGIKILKKGVVDKLILSGGVRKRPGYQKFIGSSESAAEIMKIYVLERGVRKNQIILEDLCEDTAGQLIFLKQGILDPRKIRKAVIITNDYHAPKVKKEIDHIFGSKYSFSHLSVKSKLSLRIKKKFAEKNSLKEFYRTFNGINFLSDGSVLKSLLDNHPFYNHNKKFYKKELDKMILKNLIKIPYSKQTIDKRDLIEVMETLKNNFITTGPKIKEFEEGFSKYVGAKYSVAVSSGTAALHLACLAVGLKKGEELITSPMTFAASANCALYCDAKPVFADINDQGLINEKEIEKKITKKTKIIIPVHYTGLPCNMEKINKIARKRNLVVIEDACHALGSRYKNSKIGDCKYSDMSVFSFHPVKHITTGEGGMITTNSKKLYEKLIALRTHGITNTGKDKGAWYYEMHDLGFNYRLTDIQCALGINQLRKIKKFVEKRRAIVGRYNSLFKNHKNIEIIRENGDQFNSHHLYVIKLKNVKIRKELYEYLKKKNIFCQIHYIPIYWHPYYQKLGYKKGICPESEKFYNKILSIPAYPKLSEEEQNYVIEKINSFFRKE